MSPYDSREADIEYINAAPNQAERRRRKAQVFHRVYGIGGDHPVWQGPLTDRLVINHLPLWVEIPRPLQKRAGTPREEQ